MASNWRIWFGWALSGLAILFLIMDGVMKLVGPSVVVEAQEHLGYPGSVTFGLGVLLLACTALYAIPKTSLLGAILLTGYLGGAIASQLRIGEPWFSHILFGVYLGLFVWGGLYLRSEKLRAIFPVSQ
jgi:hypothetical protein